MHVLTDVLISVYEDMCVTVVLAIIVIITIIMITLSVLLVIAIVTVDIGMHTHKPCAV